MFLFLSSGGCKSAGTGMQKHKNLPRNYTEGKISRSICHGRTRKNTESKITHIFQSRMRERRFFLAQASTTFIAYLYKPEAQAKVLQIPVYYLHIIPSLALQACKARDTLRVGFHIRSSLWTKERSPFDKLRDRGSVRSVSLPNWPLSSRKGKISFNISLGAKSKSCKWRSCSGASPSQLLCLKTNPNQLMGCKSGGG